MSRKKDKRLSKNLLEEYPSLDKLMFENKDLIRKDKEKKKFLEWQRNKKRNF